MRTPESRAFWEAVDKSAEEVKKWPQWKRDAARLSIPDPDPELYAYDGDYSYWPKGPNLQQVLTSSEKAQERVEAWPEWKRKVSGLDKQQISQKWPWIMKRFGVIK